MFYIVVVASLENKELTSQVQNLQHNIQVSVTSQFDEVISVC